MQNPGPVKKSNHIYCIPQDLWKKINAPNPKKGNKKKNKNKNNKQTQQSAFGPQPMKRPRFKSRDQGSSLVDIIIQPGLAPKPPQAPKPQQGSLDNFTNDMNNSPNIPATSSWKPVGSNFAKPSKSRNQSDENITITPSRAEKWQKFRESLMNKLEKKADITEKKQKQFTQMLNQNAGPKKGTSGQEICWELNTLDEKDFQKASGNNQEELPDVEEPHTPKVFHPQAHEIIFNKIKNIQSSKPMPKHVTQAEDIVDRHVVSKEQTIPGSPAPFHKPSDYRSVQKSQQQIHIEKYTQMMSVQMGSSSLLSYPKGIPKSFLNNQQTMGAIQPQLVTDDNAPGWIKNATAQTPVFEPQPKVVNPPIYVQTNHPGSESPQPQQYSPSDAYVDGIPIDHEFGEGSESPSSGQKRLSAFQRLGPLSQPKKPKLTINLLCNKEESVREVVDETEIEDKFTPVHQRQDMKDSTDETVSKYLPYWPWRRSFPPRKSVTARSSKSVMILEQEQMEEVYDKDNQFIQVTVKGYPPSWKKEDVIDAILDSVKGKSFIPCFIEFDLKECKFLVIRSRSALTTIHKLGFYIRKDDVELGVTISQVDISLKQLDFIPRLVLRKRLAQGYDGERKLSLKEFTTKYDISHFLYFPLNRLTNQSELVQLQSTVAWDYLTDLDLSHNRITSLDGFELPTVAPKLKHLDVSFNRLQKATALLRCRDLALLSLKLEGNPLCHDYIDPEHYVRVVRMMFPTLKEIDGLPIQLKGDMLPMKRNFCPHGAEHVVNTFLEVFFPLLDASPDERSRIEALYDEKAVMTVTYKQKLRHSPVYRYFRNIFLRSRVFDEGEVDSIIGAQAIAKLINRWPALKHDPFSFTIDVLHHTDTSAILRIGGILKLTAESLAEDEHLLAFTRNLVLATKNGVEYKIQNEMIYWTEPSKAYANTAFQLNAVRSKPLTLKLESTPDEDLKAKLVDIFIKITNFDKKPSERCLELKDWNLKSSLEYFMKLMKLGDLESLKN